MKPSRLPILAVALLMAASPTLRGQLNRNVIYLDPAHGGPDTGALLPNHVVEKDVTLAFNAKLRTALAAAGFVAISPRDADPTVVLSADQRAASANRAHPLACILLHATSSGSGIHLFTASYDNAFASADPPQAAYITQSLTLVNLLGNSFQGAKIPVILTSASVAPLDDLACPAIALEIAPLPAGSAPTPITDAVYQQHIVQAIVIGLQRWRIRNPAPPRPPAPPPASGVTP